MGGWCLEPGVGDVGAAQEEEPKAGGQGRGAAECREVVVAHGRAPVEGERGEALHARHPLEVDARRHLRRQHQTCTTRRSTKGQRHHHCNAMAVMVGTAQVVAVAAEVLQEAVEAIGRLSELGPLARWLLLGGRVVVVVVVVRAGGGEVEEVEAGADEGVEAVAHLGQAHAVGQERQPPDDFPPQLVRQMRQLGRW